MLDYKCGFINSRLAVTVWEIVGKAVIANLERKAMKTTDRIFDLVSTSTELMTLKQMQDQLELKPGIVSGSLASLVKSGRLTREKVERSNGNGPKMQWAYGVAKVQQPGVESSVD